MSHTISIGIGGAAGQGVATPGDIFAKIFSRRGLHLNAYNAYQSIIRGGHTFLTIRAGVEPVMSMGDTLELLIPLNQDTMDRHLRLLGAEEPASTTPTASSPATSPKAFSFAHCRSPNWPISAKTKWRRIRSPWAPPSA